MGEGQILSARLWTGSSQTLPLSNLKSTKPGRNRDSETERGSFRIWTQDSLPPMPKFFPLREPQAPNTLFPLLSLSVSRLQHRQHSQTSSGTFIKTTLLMPFTWDPLPLSLSSCAWLSSSGKLALSSLLVSTLPGSMVHCVHICILAQLFPRAHLQQQPAFHSSCYTITLGPV